MFRCDDAILEAVVTCDDIQLMRDKLVTLKKSTNLGLTAVTKTLNRLQSYFQHCTNHVDISATAHSMKSLCDQLRQQFDACKKEIDRVQNLLNNICSAIADAETEINDKADEKISLIQKQRDDLLSSLYSRNDSLNRSLGAVCANISSCLSVNIGTAKLTGELLEKCVFGGMPLNFSSLSRQVSRLCSFPDVLSAAEAATSSASRDLNIWQNSQGMSCFFRV